MLENDKNKLKKLENETRIDNLKEFINALSEFENLDDFLEHVGLVNENQKKTHVNSIKLMTFHAAKVLNLIMSIYQDGRRVFSQALEL